MVSATLDLPSHTASLPCDRYQILLLGDIGKCVCVWTTCQRYR